MGELIKYKVLGIVFVFFWVKFFRFWLDFWIMMNCIIWNEDWYFIWNCYFFDSVSFVIIFLEFKEVEYIIVR